MMKLFRLIAEGFSSWANNLEERAEKNRVICHSPEEIHNAMMAGLEPHQIKYEEKKNQ